MEKIKIKGELYLLIPIPEEGDNIELDAISEICKDIDKFFFWCKLGDGEATIKKALGGKELETIKNSISPAIDTPLNGEGKN